MEAQYTDHPIITDSDIARIIYSDYLIVTIKLDSHIVKYNNLKKAKLGLLVHGEVSFAQLLAHIRTIIGVKSTWAIYGYCDNVLIVPSKLLLELRTFYGIGNMLTIHLAAENFFG